MEAVYQGIDAVEMFDASKARPASSNFSWMLRPKQDVSEIRMLTCLKKCLQAHSALRAVVVPLEHDTVFPSAPHVVLKSSVRWLDTLAQVAKPVDSVESLQEFAQAPTSPFAHAGGPCFKGHIVPVAGSARPGLFLAVNHAVFDAVSISQFLDDLEDMLAGTSTEPRSLIPHSVFADMYHLYKDGAAGKASMNYQMDKLQQLDSIEACLWPPLKGPGFMIGNDAGWRHWDGSPGEPADRVSHDEAAGKRKGEPVTRSFELPGLQTLKASHGIEPFAVVKAALAIYNVSQTKWRRAVFSSTEAGRKWPFMESWIASQLPSPMDVAGPTLGWAFDLIDVEPSTIAGELLHRVIEAQKLNTEHCHAPWASIIRDLGPKRGALIHDIAARQVVAWDPTTKRRAQSRYRFLELLDRQAFLDFGLFWNSGLETPARIAAFAMYDDVHMERKEVEDALGRVQVLMEWLSEAGSWDRNVKELLL